MTQYKLVPIEPTSDQLNDAADVMKVQWQNSRSLQSEAADIYKAMLESAPDVGGEAVDYDEDAAKRFREILSMLGIGSPESDEQMMLCQFSLLGMLRHKIKTLYNPPDAAKRIAELEKHRDLFASGIAEIAIELGITDGSADLSGPQLLMLVDDIKTSISNYSQLDADKARLVDAVENLIGNKTSAGWLGEIDDTLFSMLDDDGYKKISRSIAMAKKEASTLLAEIGKELASER